MEFSVRQVQSAEHPVRVYWYDIFDGTRLVARYWHDHRGDEHGIEFVDGQCDEWPVGRRADFLTGGGPVPLRLSKAAVQYLQGKLSKDRASPN
jgi:hypothetical protein